MPSPRSYRQTPSRPLLSPEHLGLVATVSMEAENYQRNPVGYMQDVLNLQPWTRQQQIANLLFESPYKVLVRASHGVGKTWMAAAMTSFWFDCYPEDSCVITTAPTAREVRDLLWAEVRRQRRAVGRVAYFSGARAPELFESESHFAKGFTASTGESFQGRHLRHMLFIFDEAVGVDPIFWETTKSMFQSDGRHAWLAICNPTDIASQAYQEEMSTDLDGNPAWHIVTMSAMDHPNVTEELQGRPPIYPSAVTLAQVNTWVADWCEPIFFAEYDDEQGDFEWPPGSGRWYRPGPLFESRAAGRWPRQGTYGVWSEIAWRKATAPPLTPWLPLPYVLPVIGCDLASHGDDDTEMHVRWGWCSIHHERHNGWLEDRTAGRLKQLCEEYAEAVNRVRDPNVLKLTPQEIPVNYDADGRGGSLASHRGDFNFIGIHASGVAIESSKYPNRRSELWFNAVRMARAGLLNLSRLERSTLERLQRQALSPTWRVNASGQCEVEPKRETKKRLKHSPDGMDAVNLAYYTSPPFEAPTSLPAPPRARESARINDVVSGREGRGRRLFGGS